MTMRTIAWLLAGLLLLSGCFEDSKSEILAKAEQAGDKAGLRDALGEPDDVDKVGPLETWTYKASDGSVSFVIAGDTVTLSKTQDKTE